MHEALRIVIVGAGGRLGAALQRELGRSAAVRGFTRAQLDLSDPENIRRQLAASDFNVLINAAAQTNVDRCETNADEAFALNAEAPRVLARICQEQGARLVQISTDYVFDGDQREPYRENDEAHPISIYGASKLEGERRVLAADPANIVARVSWVFGPDRPSFVDWIVQQAREKEHVTAVADKISTPSYTIDLAGMLWSLLSRTAPGGIWHLANDGQCSWQEYGQWALDCCQAEGVPIRAREVGAISLAEMKNFVARRPVNSVLATDRFQQFTGTKPRPWRAAVAEYVRGLVR